MKTYLNLGCGNRFFSDWSNIDFESASPDVQAFNLLKGIPYPDNSFDVVYHSHVLEHFPKSEGEFFIQECYRVLKKGGILRVAVPDLEQIVNEYLKNLQDAKLDIPRGQERYTWSMLELYDQTVRVQSGGEMSKYWRQEHIPEEGYIAERIGQEFFSFRTQFKKITPNRTLKTRGTPRWFSPSVFKQKLIIWLTKEPKIFQYIKVGKFRLGGEVHQWMYDEYSLRNIFQKVGFTEINRQDAFSSLIQNWEKYQWLDVENRQTRKPDSLFMEGRK